MFYSRNYVKWPCNVELNNCWGVRVCDVLVLHLFYPIHSPLSSPLLPSPLPSSRHLLFLPSLDVLTHLWTPAASGNVLKASCFSLLSIHLSTRPSLHSFTHSLILYSFFSWYSSLCFSILFILFFSFLSFPSFIPSFLHSLSLRVFVLLFLYNHIRNLFKLALLLTVNLSFHRHD